MVLRMTTLLAAAIDHFQMPCDSIQTLGFLVAWHRPCIT
jgi:hypothetical protein